ncbi:ATP phosphoribosyltransferase regulatory subunit [Aureimonas pseudogalii]|uniref:Histidine--tRNA ligase n=1 Tax=Aureimonas pseudogalii TaxID=1744844 RepID=A0A7W6H2H6_9HYPH|nr:ATP phosphoribosyltransferase regulatory subunit [Aureimonas pseudogalii]MBB3996650.1 ATP phosphoribosyltransferase regulatory subunit [Aureimonas pseudogalii]
MISIERSAGPTAEGSPVDLALARLFHAAGAVTVSTPILQRAEPYLDTAGEDLRRRIFLTRGEAGETLCLRPDFTIPVCLAHIAGGEGLPRRYAYHGLVFRQHRDGAAEFRQAGIESLGDDDRAAADARTLADALAGLGACGIAETAPLEIVLGDQALFEAFLGALALPAGWQRRLVRTFGRDDLLDAALNALAREGEASSARLPPEIRALVEAGSVKALADHVAGLMEEGGLPPHRGRTPREIAVRLFEKVELAETRMTPASLARLRRFLALDCPLAEAPGALAALEADTGVDLGPALAFFRQRNDALAAAGVDLGRLRYRAAFGRAIDYYTGLVFEARRPGAAEPLAGGGRYDRLVGYLGAARPIPAVGFSLWLDRISAVAGETA